VGDGIVGSEHTVLGGVCVRQAGGALVALLPVAVVVCRVSDRSKVMQRPVRRKVHLHLEWIAERGERTVTTRQNDLFKGIHAAPFRGAGAWCLLFVLIRHGLRGGSGPQPSLSVEKFESSRKEELEMSAGKL
jgi:hypothetical protein